MKRLGLKVEVVLISFAVVFLVIFLGQMLLNRYLVTRPLDEAAGPDEPHRLRN